jgi:HD-like signal output (HDOD) protein
MPVMDGYRLLEIIKHQNPDIIRLVLSGYTDEKTIYRLFHNNLAKMCIYKPWDNNELINCINQVFELNCILTSNSMLHIIKNIDNIPVLNNVYSELCILMDKDAGFDEIEDLLMKDQAVIADILRLANSAFINIKTGSIKKAISYIGLKQIKNLVLVASLPQNILRNRKNTYIYDLFSKHSLLTNKLCNLVYTKFLYKEIPPDSSCIGLIHEVGRIVLINNFDQEYGKITFLASTDKRPLYEIEKEVLGVSHQEMSSYLLNWWGFPFNLVDAILYHHTPLEDNVMNKELASVLHIADYYAAKCLSFPWANTIDNNIFEFLNIDINEFETFIYDNDMILEVIN